jgi:parvulin-like peptidyl-prolyl isomerase
MAAAMVVLAASALAQAPRRPPPGGPVSGWPSADVFQDSIGRIDTTSLPANSDMAAADAEPFDRFEPAETMAQVGDQYILKGELIGEANVLLFEQFQQIRKLPAEQQQQALTAFLAQRDQFAMDQLLQPAIDRKLMYLEFVRSQPVDKDEKKMAEMKKELQKRVHELFREKLTEMATKVRGARPEEYVTLARDNNQLFRLALVMKSVDIESPDDPRFELLLRENGTSLRAQQQAYMERTMGQSVVGRAVNFNQEITHDQLLNYYQTHLHEFQVPTRAKWEQLSVLFRRMPDKAAAWDLIVQMGNQVVFGGASLEAVARRSSHEKNAARDGGYHDWTPFNDFGISRVINDAVFTLPLNELSPILEDEEGLHIVRVLGRTEAHVKPFSEAQIEIKERLKMEMRNDAYKQYVQGLRKKTPIWTIFDDPLTAGRLTRPLRR